MKVRRTPLAIVGGAMVGAVTLMAIFAAVLAPYDPHALAGNSFLRPSAQHLLGTNDIGQDIFSQLIWGARASLVVAVGAAALAVAVGTVVGVGSGLLGGAADMVIMRVVDAVLAVPRLPLLVLIAALAGARQANVLLIIGLFTWPVIARQLRSQTLTLRSRGFVHSARGLGGGFAYIMRRHLVPALSPLLVTGFVAVASNAVLLQASLAFLGLADPTGVSWGLMLNRALLLPGLYFTPLWTWWVLPTGFVIAFTVVGFAFIGVGVETILNPRSGRPR